MGSIELFSLESGYAVDQAIQYENKPVVKSNLPPRVVVLRFGWDNDPDSMAIDHLLGKLVIPMEKTAVFYRVDIRRVPDFNVMYELTESCVMFFYKNKHFLIDQGTGNNNKVFVHTPRDDTEISMPREDMEELVNRVYVAGSSGKGIVDAHRDFSTSHKY